jgi:hypothetical protein
MAYYNFEELVSNKFGTHKVKMLKSFARLNTKSLKTIFVKPAENRLQTLVKFSAKAKISAEL